jgi:hypothetical protein
MWRRCRKACWRASFSVTRKAPSAALSPPGGPISPGAICAGADEGDDEDDDDDAAIDRLLKGNAAAAASAGESSDDAGGLPSSGDVTSDDDMMGMSPDEPSLLLGGGSAARDEPFRSDFVHNPFRAHAQGRAAWPSAGV